MYRYLHLTFLFLFSTFLLFTTSFAQVDYKINFSDMATPPPSGWLQDYGQPYGDRGGVTYGWLETDGTTPLDLTSNGRNRPPSPDDDTILETLVHLEYSGNPNGGNTTEGVWAIALPNGTYRVKVTVGDSQFGDSEHVLNAEGINLLYFEQSGSNWNNGVEKIIEVTDGQLLIDSEMGNNTKISSIEINDNIPTPQPFVISSIPSDGDTDVSLTTTISANNLDLPNQAGNGATSTDNSSISTNTVQLFKHVTSNKLERVPASVNGTGGGDAINLTPNEPLQANTTYTYRINGVKDLAGFYFVPYEVTFTTGSGQTQQTSLDDVEFTNQGAVASNAKYTSLTFGPEGKLYGLTITGYIHRWTVNSDGSLSDRQVMNSLVVEYGERAAVGLAFDPAATANNLIAYVSHCSMELDNAPAWDGKLSRLSGNNLQNEELLITNLPRSVRDHLVNSIAFRPGEPNGLYFIQSSNSAGGAADGAWGNRPERLMAAALLRLDLNKLPSNLPIDAQTTDNQSVINNAPGNLATMSDGSYNPYYVDAPITMYATGIRNAYDLVWHSNGQCYIPTNGTAGGSNTPASVDGTRRIDGSFYNYSDPQYPQVPGTRRNETQRDWLFRVNPNDPHGYYGHPNPFRGEYVMNRGKTDVDKYPNGVEADENYRGAAFDFGFNKSPNGVIEYKNSSVFGGALSGAILVVRYSNGDDIIALLPDTPKGDIGTSKELIPGFSGFNDPLDLVEDVSNGNIYVAEYFENQEGGRISLLKPNAVANPAPTVSFVDPDDGENFPVGTDLYVNVNASDNGSITKVELYLNGTFVRAEGLPPYEWGDPNQHNDPLLQNMQQGTYELRAVATDDSGKTGESTITITVGEVVMENDPPTVVFVAPTDGEDFPVGTDLYVNVNASDSDGTITKVDLFIDDVFVRSETDAPYEWGDDSQNDDPLLQNLQSGEHTLKAVATDNEGASSEATIMIMVSDENEPIRDIYFVTPDPDATFPEGSNVDVLVEAADTNLVRHVDLYINGEGISRKEHAPYEWGSSNDNNDPELQDMAPGTYELQAIAKYDNNVKESEFLTFTIEEEGDTMTMENELPMVAFDTPTNMQDFPEGTDLYVKVNASDSDGSVTQVDLYLDGQFVRSEGAAPYEWGDPNQSNDVQLQNMQVGTYNLRAVATDNEGATSETEITVTISEEGGNGGGGGSTEFGEAIPWVEPFNLADGTDNDGTPTSWNTIIKNVLSGGSAGVEAERMKVNGASCDWFSKKIDVSEVDFVELSAEVQGTGALGNSDDIKLAYRAEGSRKWLLWARPTGAFTTQTVSDIVDVTGKNHMELAFRIVKLGTDQTFFLDNISVVETTDPSLNGEAIESRYEEVVFETENLLVYPNPTAEMAQIQLSNWKNTDIEITIVDVLGKTVLQENIENNKNAQYPINVSEWVKGAYFITAKTSSGVQMTDVLVVD
ncbi:MAG: Ig-like domain-containing protein [Bacteroidota bacterium]